MCCFSVANTTYTPIKPLVQGSSGLLVRVQVLLLINGQSCAMGWSVLELFVSHLLPKMDQYEMKGSGVRTATAGLR